jgi:hypothetical protein
MKKNCLSFYKENLTLENWIDSFEKIIK